MLVWSTWTPGTCKVTHDKDSGCASQPGAVDTYGEREVTRVRSVGSRTGPRRAHSPGSGLLTPSRVRLRESPGFRGCAAERRREARTGGYRSSDKCRPVSSAHKFPTSGGEGGSAVRGRRRHSWNGRVEGTSSVERGGGGSLVNLAEA